MNTDTDFVFVIANARAMAAEIGIDPKRVRELEGAGPRLVGLVVVGEIPWTEARAIARAGAARASCRVEVSFLNANDAGRFTRVTGDPPPPIWRGGIPSAELAENRFLERLARALA